MVTENNRTCVVCGKSYKACKNCEDVVAKGGFRWRNSCDTPECFQVLMVISDFYYDKLPKKDARELLDMVLTDEMKPYDPNAKTLIDKIYDLDAGVEVEPKKEVSVEVESVEHAPVIEPIKKEAIVKSTYPPSKPIQKDYKSKSSVKAT